jgi:hypothetical protein
VLVTQTFQNAATFDKVQRRLSDVNSGAGATSAGIIKKNLQKLRKQDEPVRGETS